MLVVSRKQEERIVILRPPGSGPVVVTVVEIDGDRVRIGFEADGSTEIYREEVFKRLASEWRKAQT